MVPKIVMMAVVVHVNVVKLVQIMAERQLVVEKVLPISVQMVIPELVKIAKVIPNIFVMQRRHV